ncbi:uncharacterized protein YwbO-like [Littorina saxatilis]|uniref:DSBA-like thioredoxin domain-containing protein n=1 Tax=Littorina saxatilis TaxID=31220 RepID=A0AAN9APK5_9CAEN
MEANKPVVSVEVVGDLVCPWCWIGKRKLEKAMESLSDRFQFHVRWSPYLLRPDIPVQGIPVEDEDVSPAKKKTEQKRAKRAGDEVGLDLTFSSPLIPCTAQSHALVRLAGTLDTAGHPSLQSSVVERIFMANLTEGKSLTKSDLLTIATEAGLDADDVKHYITLDSNLNDVRATASDWTKRGVTGVPCFYINGQRMFCGAQDVEMFKRMVCMAAQKSKSSAQNAAQQAAQK